MDLLKLFVESYVQLIGHIAWPLAIVVILFIFRKPIMNKLQGLIKASKGDTSLEFAIGLQEKISKEKPKLSKITKDSLVWDNYLDALERWAGWYILYTLKLRQICKDQPAKEVEIKLWQNSRRNFKLLTQKIEENRPDSKFLKFYQEFEVNCLSDEFLREKLLKHGSQ